MYLFDVSSILAMVVHVFSVYIGLALDDAAARGAPPHGDAAGREVRDHVPSRAGFGGIYIYIYIYIYTHT